MPIILSPETSPVVSTIQCDDQLIVQPKVAEIEGREAPGRIPAVAVAQGQEAYVRWILRNQDGDAVDLSGCGFTPSTVSSLSSASSASSDGDGGRLKLRVREALSFSSSYNTIELEARVIDTAAGLVESKLSSEVVKCPGIYKIEWGVYTVGGDLLFTNQGYLIVNRGLFGSEVTSFGPLTIPEIRLHLRDSDPNENFLIDALEFDLAELAACIERPILAWNETPPPISKSNYTTSNFPYRLKWLDATVSGLYSLAAHHYRRNSKSFSAASGVNLDDKMKASEYEQKSQALWQDFEKWVKLRKVSLNMDECFGGTSERIL